MSVKPVPRVEVKLLPVVFPALYAVPGDGKGQRGHGDKQEGGEEEMSWAQVEYLPDVEPIPAPIVNQSWSPPRYGIFSYNMPSKLLIILSH